MSTKEQTYSVIAECLRNQPVVEVPQKHEWLELLNRLARDDSRNLQEISTNERSNSIKPPVRPHH